jgi:DNA repair exonuclease SbcCD ATPase subunit
MSLNKAARRDIIEDLLDLTIFTNMNVKLKEQINDNLRSIDNITADKRVIDEKIKIIKEHIKKSENSNKQIIDDKKERIADSIKTLNFKKSEIDELEINIKTLEKESKDDKKLRSKLHKFDSVRFQLESNIKSIRNDMTFFKENDDCPTCRQKIDNVFRDDSIFKCSHELKRLDSGIKELDEQRNIINDDINKNDEILSSLRELRFKKQTKEFECDNINSYIKTLEDEISQISSIIDIDDEIKNSLGQITLKKKLYQFH